VIRTNDKSGEQKPVFVAPLDRYWKRLTQNS